MKQTGIYLILGGAVVFILVFIGKIMALVFNNPLLGLALMAVVIGVFILLFKIASNFSLICASTVFTGTAASTIN